MSNQKRNSEEEQPNAIDEFFLNQKQEGELARPESVEAEVFDVKADDLLYAPNHPSQEHSLDDTHETLTHASLETEALDEAAEDALK